jgi:hypothetical protein
MPLGKQEIDRRRRLSNKTPQGKARHRFHNQQTRNKKYKVISDYLASHPCVDCGNSDVRVLQFDHVKGKKLGTISNIIRVKHAMSALLEEIAKCETRCANCHLIRHWRKLNEG